MKRIFIMVCVLAIVLLSSIAQAHMLWLNASNHYPNIGESVKIEVGWGHKFPKDEIIKKEWLKGIYALTPNGEKISLNRIDDTHYTFTPNISGSYIVAAFIKPGFLTKTTSGYKLQNKKGLKNAISCFNYDMRAKVVVQVGKDKKGLSQKAGHPLEIIPLFSPEMLNAGMELPLKVLFRNKPLSDVKVDATYAGFSGKNHTAAYTIRTCNKGEAKIKILKKGHWMINVTNKFPYHDTEVCDDYQFNTTLTFEVR